MSHCWQQLTPNDWKIQYKGPHFNSIVSSERISVICCLKDGYNSFHAPSQCDLTTTLITKRWHLSYVLLNMGWLCGRLWLRTRWNFVPVVQNPHLKRPYNFCLHPLGTSYQDHHVIKEPRMKDLVERDKKRERESCLNFPNLPVSWK